MVHTGCNTQNQSHVILCLLIYAYCKKVNFKAGFPMCLIYYKACMHALEFGWPFYTYIISSAYDFKKTPWQKIWKISSLYMKIWLLDRVENIVTKGDIAHHEQFTLFGTIFFKTSILSTSNASTCLEMLNKRLALQRCWDIV